MEAREVTDPASTIPETCSTSTTAGSPGRTHQAATRFTFLRSAVAPRKRAGRILAPGWPAGTSSAGSDRGRIMKLTQALFALLGIAALVLS
jgi:hypothetical protein